MKTIEKDPDAVLDYYWDWTDWLPDGEAIDEAEFESSDEDLVVDDSVIAGSKVIAILSGGTPGTFPTVTCRVTTNGTPPKTDDRTIRFEVKER